MCWWPPAAAGCSGCWSPHRPVSRAPSGPNSGWPPPTPPWSCTATTPPSPGRTWPPRSPSEVRLLRATQAELATHSQEAGRARYRRVDPDGPGPQPARPGHHRRARPGRHHGQGQPLCPPRASSAASPAWPPRPPRPATATARANPSARPATGCSEPPWSAPPTTPAAKTLSWPASTGSRWSSAAKTTSARLRAVAAHLAERAWTVMDRGTPYVVCDTDGTPVTPRPGQGHHRRPLDRARTGPPTATQQEGEGPSASPHRTCAWRSRRNEATLPLLGHSWPNNPAASSQPRRNLDSQASNGNQTITGRA